MPGHNPAIDRIRPEGALQVLDEVARLRAAGRKIINLGIGQPDFDPPAHVIEATVAALRDGPHGYTPVLGIGELREACAQMMSARCGQPIAAARIAVVPGSKLTLTFATQVLANSGGAAGTEMLYPDPGFPPYRSAIAYSGAAPVAYPLNADDGFDIDAAAILARITPRTRLLILNAPSNPCGGGVTRAALDQLATGLRQWPQVTVLSDEIYADLSYSQDGAQLPSLLEYAELQERVIVLQGWSKSHAMTGWRIGFGVWPERLIEPLRRLVMIGHSCVNVAAQYGALAAVQGPQQPVAQMRDAFRARRELLVDGLNALPGVSCALPRGAFYAFADIRGSGLDEQTFAARLLAEQGVAAIPGSDFGAAGEGHLRLSFAADESQLRRALAGIARLLDEVRGG